MIIKKHTNLRGEISVPGDKSISHRSIMFGAISKGITHVEGFLPGADCISTIECFRSMGVDILREGDKVRVEGKGLHGLKAPEHVLDTGNSGTTTRLISGILSGQDFESSLNGDESIRKRPMGRIITPLKMMGADISGSGENGMYAPLTIKPSHLTGIDYNSPVASAQVKSAVLLAGLYADGKTSVTEPSLSRNHTELMLKGFGADVISDGLTAVICPPEELYAQDIQVPGDISSAAYFIAAGLIVPGSEVLIRNVGINPTRAGIIEVCKAMGGSISLLNERSAGGEPAGDILVKYSSLTGTVVEGDMIPTLIDEIPIIAVMAAFAKGRTVIKDAAELKVKESNRIDTVCEGLKAMGCDITPTDDGMIIEGGKMLHGASINSYLDHRIAMSFAIAALASGECDIENAECVNISYPNFYDDLARLAGN